MTAIITGSLAKSNTATSDAPTSETASARKLPALFEFCLVFATAFAAFAIHLLWMHVPNCTLVFDSTGYLAVTNSWLKLCTPEFAGQVVSYIVNGFQPLERAQLVHTMGSAAEVLKTGPLLPLFLAMAYAIAHVPAISQHWQVGALCMVGVQSLTVALMWAVADSAWNRTTARLAAVLALSYTGLVVNAGRLMSELPATLAIILAAWVLIQVVKGRRSLLQGTLLGFSMALLMVARSVLVLVPFILLPLLFLLLKKSTDNGAAKQTKLFSPGFIVCAASSLVLTLAPWIFCEQVLTGRPSIMIDRYGAYNLFTGLDVKNDALDVLPSPFVSHPEQFQGTPTQAVSRALKNASQAPMAFANMFLRKPSRLIDSPWSDFQVTCWLTPWTAQVWWHQLLVVLASFGFLQSMAKAIRSKDPAQAAPPAVLGTIIFYHFINSAFISMRRYMFPAMPEIIIFAAVALVFAWNERRRGKPPVAFLLAATALPSLNAFLDLGMRAPHDWLSKCAAACGPTIVQYSAAATVTTCALLWFAFCSRELNLRGIPRLHKISWAAAVIIAAATFASTAQVFSAMEFSLPLANNTPWIQVDFPKINLQPHHRCFLLVDGHTTTAQPQPLASLSISVDGKTLPSQLRPLFELDQNQRENFLYERVFAASAGTEADSFRQWFAAEIPAAQLNVATHAPITTIDITNTKPGEPVYLAADIKRRQDLQHDLSLTRFSWTKGFMINPAGEMRIDEWTSATTKNQTADRTSRRSVIPRVHLLIVESDPKTDDACNTISLPATKIGKSASERLFQYTVSQSQMPSFVQKRDALNLNAVQITVSGRVHAIKDAAEASVGVVEYVEKGGQTHEDLAPLAPSVIQASPGKWTNFQFDDIIPLGTSDSGANNSDRLRALRIIVAGHSWFDALQYASYRPKAPVEIADLEIKFTPVETIDLSRQVWRRIKPVSFAQRRL